MAERGFLSLLFVVGNAATRKLIGDALPQQTLRERNVGSYKFCETAEEAKEETAFNFPDLVFIDDVLPDMKGIELAKAILQEDASLFVVYLTSNPTMRAIEVITNLGVKGVIAKPFSAGVFDSYIQYFFKEKYKKSWKEVQAFTDKGAVVRN